MSDGDNDVDTIGMFGQHDFSDDTDDDPTFDPMTHPLFGKINNYSDTDSDNSMTTISPKIKRFPTKDEKQRRKWIQAVKRKDWEPSRHSRICSLHFQETDIDRTSLSCVRIREGGVPTIFPDHLFESEVEEYKSNKRNVQLESEIPTHSSVESPSKRLKTELSKRELEDLKITKKKIKILQQTIRRQNKRIAKLEDFVHSLKSNMNC